MDVWLNGSIVPREQANVSAMDRGFLFGDGVYEAVVFFNGVGVGLAAHTERLRKSLAMAKIEGFEPGHLGSICKTLLQANSLSDAFVYVQVTRGVEAMRSHVPTPGTQPTVFAMARPAPPLESYAEPKKMRCAVVEDHRWRLCSIKTISLMGNVLAAMRADETDADEAIMHRGGYISEGTHTNVFAVSAGRVITPEVDTEPPILHGVTRQLAIDAAKGAGMRVEVRPLRVSELREADEVFLTSTSLMVAPVVELDGKPVGNVNVGEVGPVSRRLLHAVRAKIASQCGVTLAAAAGSAPGR